jgi:tRNA/rRNA methyltransferase
MPFPYMLRDAAGQSSNHLPLAPARRYALIMAGTDTTRAHDFGAAPAVILVNPQLGENIGTAARAMANFGLSALRIVDPRDGWPNDKARSAASGADWIIDGAQVYGDLFSALGDLHHVYATTARPRDMIKQVVTPEAAAADMHRRIVAGERLGILFGRERWGLNNDEVSLAAEIISAPVNPAFASLNIAQAVLLVGYEWFKTIAPSLGQATPELAALAGPGLRTTDTRPATRAEMMGFFTHLEGELAAAGFYKTAEKKPGMVRNVRNLFQRADLTEQEVKTLRGMVAALTRAHAARKAKGQGQ